MYFTLSQNLQTILKESITMTYKSKRTITSMVAGVLLITSYIIFALGKRSPSPEDLKAWAIAMLVFIGIGVAVLILIQILFNLAVSIGIAVKEREHDDKEVEKEVGRIISSSMVEDEMDKLINLKSSHIGYCCMGTGFILALVAMAFGVSTVVSLHILFGIIFVETIVKGGVSIYLYEKGVHNG